MQDKNLTLVLALLGLVLLFTAAIFLNLNTWLGACGFFVGAVLLLWYGTNI